jgi:ribosome biogenesis GTPase
MTIHETPRVEATGRVVAHFRGRYVVRAGGRDRDAVVSGRLSHEALDAQALPAVGDYVALDSPSDADGICRIEQVLPRRSAFLRKAAGAPTEPQVLAANVDVALIASALPHDLSLHRIERYLTLAWESGATPVVVLTKCDLVDDANAAVAAVQRVALGVEVIAVSTVSMMNVDRLTSRIGPETTAVLLGSSGVGKSTLVNALLGVERQRTSDIRGDGTGRHTTTHRELVELPSGGYLIDTPGLREVQLWSADDGFERVFDDVESLAAGCRFADCAHDTEPDCAVLAAVGDGTLSAERLESWRALRRELAYLERKQDVAAAAAAKRHVKSLERLGRARLEEKGR